ncbi:F-box domain-containing protein [Plasmodiophora brassicae]|uniref:F-box domain-containing protein n=1 Tax=Plasmodiophora brassicae TaxID=37360 RepID=A0A0G4IIZ6_PLABS|nr:hypothetical protein PBRA_003905 [Plasmodiophora brassicae]SPQ96412.1 unnamed protein product [Plasmodiophora brassicae]
MRAGGASWDDLPVDLVVRALSYCDVAEVVRVERSCWAWRYALQGQKALWRAMLLAMEWAMFPDDVRHPERKRAIRLARLSRRYRLYREPSGTLALMKIVATGGRTAGTSSLIDRVSGTVQRWPIFRPGDTDLAVRSVSFSTRRNSSCEKASVRIVDMRDTVRPSPYPNTRLFQGPTALLIVIDRTSRDSATRARQIATAFRRYLGERFQTIPLAFAGTKSDLKPSFVVPATEIFDLVNDFGSPYFETSAMLRKGCDAPFLYLMSRMQKTCV